jgi:hypothetical protein
MFTTDSSKPFSRFASYLKFGVLLVLLGLIVVATERPMLLTPAGAMTVANHASYVSEQAKARASTQGVTTAPAPDAVPPPGDAFAYFPSQFNERAGAAEDLPPQF